jgi:hypothetical protein
MENQQQTPVPTQAQPVSPPVSATLKLKQMMAAWFAMLMGKPRSAFPSQVVQTPAVSSTTTTTDPINDDDPVAKDMAKAKEMSQKVLEVVEEKIKPIVGHKAESLTILTSITGKIKQTATSPIGKKALMGIIVLIVVLLVARVLISTIQNVQKGGENDTLQTSVTPTSAQYVITQPSVYANDATVLEIEERLSVLDNQLDNTSIRETTLTPPELDFSISFK